MARHFSRNELYAFGRAQEAVPGTVFLYDSPTSLEDLAGYEQEGTAMQCSTIDDVPITQMFNRVEREKNN